MRIPALATVLVAATVLLTPSAHSSDLDTVRVLVELDGAPTLARASTNAVRAEQNAVVADASAAGVELDVTRRLTAAYNGLVASVPRAELATLRGVSGVKAVHENTTYALTLDDSVPLVRAPDVWKRPDPAGKQADGTGMTVAIIDSGIDHRHPDFGGRVVGGYDFVNDDPDPMDDNGHGTHVAGIVAANGKVRGVAPGATLVAYKAMDQYGNGELVDIIAALDLAVAPDNPHRADVVNLSLSGPGDGTDPMSVAANRAVAAGVVVVASSGNAGPGAGTVSSPASADGVLTVGASASGITVPEVAMVSPSRQDLRGVRRPYSANPSAAPVRAEVVDIGECRPEDYAGKEVAGKALLCHAYVPFAQELELATYAQERGAVAMFFFIPDSWGVPQATAAQEHAFTTGRDDGRLDSIVAMQLPGASAATLTHQLAGGSVKVELTAVDATDELADFSSRGPTPRFAAKPELVAPGVEILSTLPNGSYGRASGTSMSAPHVAGAAALVRQLHPTWSVAQVDSALAGTAHRLALDPLLAGAGRLDVLAAATARVVANVRTVSFGLADLSKARITRTSDLSLTNVSGADVPVKLSVERSGGLDASVSVEAGKSRIPRGDSLSAQLRVSLSTPSADGEVSGWVLVDVGRDGSTDLRIPYLLAVRHLQVSASPDAVPAGASTNVFVRSPVDLTAAPSLAVECPGRPVQRPVLQPAGTRTWRVNVPVGSDGVCELRTVGRTSSVTITGENAVEVAETPLPGDSGWQPVGPNAEAGFLALGANGNRLAVLPTGSTSTFVTDDLRTWREIRTMPVAGGTTVGVEPDPAHGDALYVAVNGRPADLTYQGKVLLTPDGGTTWRTLPGPDAQIDAIALDAGGAALAVADAAGVRVTTDQGTTWNQLPKNWTLLYDLHWIGADLYLGTNRGLQVIRNAATAPDGPKQLFQPPPLGWVARVAGDAQTIVVASYPSPWLYTSTDGGATFQQVLQKTGISFQDVELVGDEIYALQGGSHLWVGADRGKSWTSWGDPNRNGVEYDFTRRADGTAYVSSSGTGVFEVTAPGTYARRGVPAANVYDLAVSGSKLVAGTFRDTFRTPVPASGLEWESSGGEGTLGRQARFLGVSRTDPNVVFKVLAGGPSFAVSRSLDGGATWQELTRPTEVPTSLLVHPADPRHIYVGYWSIVGFGLVESKDGGATWRKVDHGHAFRALAGHPTNPKRLWAGDETGLYRSDDGGLSFRQLSSVPVTALSVNPRDGDQLVVGGRGLYVSRDGGRTLREAIQPGLDMWVTDLVVDPKVPSRVYAGLGAFYDSMGLLHSGRGVLRSTNGGTSWKSIAAGLDNPNVTSLAVDRDGRYLFAGTSGGSTHRLRLR
ncbi:S8 family serine peptidase [Tenggerimyces flavus]|uniref:S8 family serine peptidase n=1 Tax=Tenggerimyces flavus TaxID=1708749 RepID=A0ABV7YEG8_9ACTN|nr:S8 family serine peptidase [Tenggerimyces flavus]MBM7784369.1 subtilisin family serine protease/photosystem II stability/assembly factor-like uncharacterized protein [Tenggerimyces flavus]